MTKPGFEEIPLDLSRVPSVEEGLADATARDRAFADLAKESLGEGTMFLSQMQPGADSDRGPRQA